jgi:hypothetical protein
LFLSLNSSFSAKLEGEEFFDRISGFCQVIAFGCRKGYENDWNPN